MPFMAFEGKRVLNVCFAMYPSELVAMTIVLLANKSLVCMSFSPVHVDAFSTAEPSVLCITDYLLFSRWMPPTLCPRHIRNDRERVLVKIGLHRYEAAPMVYINKGRWTFGDSQDLLLW